MKTYIKFAFILLAFTFSAEVFALSLTSSTSVEVKRQDVRQKINDLKSNASSTCISITNRIDTRISNFGSKYEEHKKAYEDRHHKLLEIKAMAEVEGVSTVKLEADINTLQTKIDKLEQDHLKMKVALESTKSFSCGTSREQYAKSIQEVRAAQKVVREDVRDIHNYIMTTIKSDLLEIKASVNTKIN